MKKIDVYWNSGTFSEHSWRSAVTFRFSAVIIWHQMFLQRFWLQLYSLFLLFNYCSPGMFFYHLIEGERTFWEFPSWLFQFWFYCDLYGAYFVLFSIRFFTAFFFQLFSWFCIFLQLLNFFVLVFYFFYHFYFFQIEWAGSGIPLYCIFMDFWIERIFRRLSRNIHKCWSFINFIINNDNKFYIIKTKKNTINYYKITKIHQIWEESRVLVGFFYSLYFISFYHEWWLVFINGHTRSRLIYHFWSWNW